MKPSSSLFCKGIASAVGAGVAAFVCAGFAATGLTQLFQMDATDGALFSIAFILIFHLVNLVWMGLVCTYFWHRINPAPPRLPATLLMLILYYGFPFLWSLVQGDTDTGKLFIETTFAYLLVGTLVSLWPLQLSIGFGLKWWPKRRYRHFFGLSNPWERE